MAKFLNRIGLGENSVTNYLKDTYSYKNLTFPPELNSIGTPSNHAIVFHIWNRTGTKYDNSPNAPASTIIPGNSPAKDPRTGGRITRNPSSNFDPSSVINKLPKSEEFDKLKNYVGSTYQIKNTIVLYVPHRLNTTYNADWGDASLREEESALGAAGNSWEELLKNFGALIGETATRNISKMASINLTDLFSLTTGVAANPHLETLFRGIPFRNFSFNFKLIPKNESEANTIANIEKTFRFHMAPEVVEGFGRYFRFPSEFSIEFVSNGKENKFLNKIGNCVLTSMNVNRSAGGNTSFYRPTNRTDSISGENSIGAPPTAVELDLSFKEVEVITKEKILKYNY